MSVLTEGNVSSLILSYTAYDFLFTGGVCRSWRTNSRIRCTSILTALQSVSRVKDALAAGMETIELLDISIVFGADIAVVREIANDNVCDTSMMPTYAAFTGNMEVLALLEKSPHNADLDEFTLFEAVRGGHVEAVRYILAAECDVNTIAEWPCGFYDNRVFVKNCIEMANSCGRVDVVQTLCQYTTDKYYQEDMSCVELAIRTNKVDILEVLREAGAVLPADSFTVAIEDANLEMLRYLDSVKRSPPEDFLLYYLPAEEYSFDTLELLLKNGLVEVDARDLQQAIHAHMPSTIDLLLRFGCEVDDSTIDHAIGAWDFRLAGTLMDSHGCRPTSTAYQWLFTGGLCECCVAGCYPAETDDFYLKKLDWIHNATGGKLGFSSMTELAEDFCWSVLLTRVSSQVVKWLEDRLVPKKQRVV